MEPHHIEMVLFDFDETIVRGKQGTKSRTRDLNPLSNDIAARNAKLAADVVDPLAFVSFVNTLVDCAVNVGITSFGNGPPIRWYMEALFNPETPALDNVSHPFEASIVARGDPLYGPKMVDVFKARGAGGAGYGKVLMAMLIKGDLPNDQVLVFDDNWDNVTALRQYGFNAVHTPDGLHDRVVADVIRRYTFGKCQ